MVHTFQQSLRLHCRKHRHCETHTLPDSLIYKQSALWDTQAHTHARTHRFLHRLALKSQPLAPSQPTPPSVTHFPPFLPSCLSCHSQTLAALMFAPSVLDHGDDERYQMFVHTVTLLTMAILKASGTQQI